jgi:hypothetical protein
VSGCGFFYKTKWGGGGYGIFPMFLGVLQIKQNLQIQVLNFLCSCFGYCRHVKCGFYLLRS